MRFRNALYFCQISIKSLTVQFIAFISVILGRLLEVFFLVLPFENNLLALVRVTSQVYALCRPSGVNVGVDNDSSSVIRGF